MRADCVAAEKSCVLRLRVFAREGGAGAVSGSALGKKVAETLLPGCGRALLAVSHRDTESKKQTD
jgi:hypothetical protein